MTHPEAAAFAAAGRDLLRVDRHAEAAAAFERALAALDDEATAATRAGIVAALTEARFECGRFDDSEPLLRDALAGLADDAAVARERAALELGLARVAVRARRFAEGRALLESALGRFAPEASPLLAARAEGLLGGVLAMTGELGAALERFHRARDRLRAPPLDGFVRDAARLSMNIAIACSELGRDGEAEREIAEALDLFDGLVRAGRVEALPELGRARRNHGYILARTGRHAASVETLREGVEAFRLAAATPGAARDGAMWRASRAGTLNSLGFSLFALGEFDAAEATLRESMRLFVRVVREQPAQRDEQARAIVNRAHLAAARGALPQAAALYRRGRDVFDRLVAEGRRHHDVDAANATLGLARIALRRGRAKAAVAAFETAMDTLAAATREGRLQQARAWLGGWQRQLGAWLEASAQHGPRLAPMAASLQRVLARPPQRPAGGGAEPLRVLAAAAQPVARWAADGAAVPGFDAVATAYLEHLYAWSAALLSDSDPAWLRRQADEVARCVGALGDAAAARPDAPRLLASWFFGTHGLRAQRRALAQGHDPRLAELDAVLQRLHAIEAEMLGEGQPPDDGGGAGRRVDAPAWSAAPTPYGDRRGAEWRALRERLDTLRRPLLADGLLPEVLHLDARTAAASLADDEVLLLVARPAAERARLIALRPPSAGPAFALQHEVRLAPELAAFPCDVLNQLARRAMAEAARGQPLRSAAGPPGDDATPDGDRFALDLFGRWWQQTLARWLPDLQRQGARRFALVPADDLHLVPWNHLAETALAGAEPLRVYPSGGAWWRRPRKAPPAVARWAVAAPESDAARPLTWATVERALTLRLWGPRARPLAFDADGRPLDAEADALLGMGHGGAPDGNPAHAGLSLGRTLLSAADLPRLPRCRRALLSACLLGRTEDAQGEGLGFLSAGLDGRLSFAAGWLTEVPDFAACLFSLAAQWSLRAAGDAAWSRVLADLRREIGAGRWPAGFGDWLAGEAGEHAPGLRAAAAGPPALLQRALPWAVALGD